MGIPIGFPYGMRMGNFFSLWEFPQVGILCEYYGKSIGIHTCGNPIGILWKFYANFHRIINGMSTHSYILLYYNKA